MRKILQFAAVITLTLYTVESKAQLANGSIAPNFTLTDINGVSHTLYTYLNAGKTVFMDVSATWCSPCWSYHNTNALEDLWVNHGPTGGTGVSAGTTNDVIVLFIEGDGTTNTADLNGTGTNTQGDWVTGVSHPIIDPAAAIINPFNTSYNIKYFPTMYMICPDRSVTLVGQLSATQLYAAKANCAAATVAVDAEMMLSTPLNSGLASCDSVTPTFRIGNVGTSALTSATITYKVDGVIQKTKNWTGNLATYANATITGVKVGASTSGVHTITATVSNPNAGADPTSANNSTNVTFTIYPTIGGAPVAEDFETAGIPTTWTVVGGSTTWEQATTGFNSGSSATLSWYNISSGQIDYMTLPPMSFAGSAGVSMVFDVAYAQYGSEVDKLEVQVSTNCGTTWISKYNKSGGALKTVPAQTAHFIPTLASQWRHETVDLTSYAGQSSVLVRFKGTSNYGNDLYVDNVNVSLTTGIEENNNVNNISVYPNPMSDFATVVFTNAETNNVKIELVNALGQAVLNNELGKMNAGEHSFSLDVNSLTNGFYFLNITVGNNTSTKKVSVNK